MRRVALAVLVGVALVAVLAVSYLVSPEHLPELASTEAAITLAILTVFLLLSNRDLVNATLRTANAAIEQTAVLLAAVEPELRARWRNVAGVGALQTEVHYVAGTLPARNVRVWGRRNNLMYSGAEDTVTAVDGVRIVLMQQTQAATPFTLAQPTLVANQDWVGVVWLGHGDVQHMVRWKVDPGNDYVAIAN